MSCLFFLTREETGHLLLGARPGQSSDPDHVPFFIQRHSHCHRNQQQHIKWRVSGTLTRSTVCHTQILLCLQNPLTLERWLLLSRSKLWTNAFLGIGCDFIDWATNCSFHLSVISFLFGLSVRLLLQNAANNNYCVINEGKTIVIKIAFDHK